MIVGRHPSREGHARLLAALDEAHAAMGCVEVSVAGDDARRWRAATGRHRLPDGSVRIGGERTIVVRPDSTIDGTGGGRIAHRGGHVLHGGEHLERFSLDGVAMTVAWTDPKAA